MTEKERMLSGKIYCPFKVGDNTWEKSREVLEQFNSMPWQKERERMELLKEYFRSSGGRRSDRAAVLL